jgi:hypothetical protein
MTEPKRLQKTPHQAARKLENRPELCSLSVPNGQFEPENERGKSLKNPLKRGFLNNEFPQLWH